jgi:kumamolisin
MATTKLVSIPGSNKKPFRDAKVIAAAPSDERLEVTVRIRPRNPLPDPQDMLKLSAEPMRQLTHEQYEKSYGASAKDIALVKKFAKEQNLSVVRVSTPRRSVILSGTVVEFNRAFGVSLKSYAYSGGTYRGRTGLIKIPAHLAPVVEGVFGLDNRPAATRFRALPQAAASGARPFAVSELVKLYNFPAGFDGSGQTIGLIELGGGYQPADLDTYFSNIGLATPTVIPVSVDGSANSPSTPDNDAEVALDLEVAGAAAPGAKFVVYFVPTPSTTKGILDALTKAVHDTENNPSIISISFGGPEAIPTNSYQRQFDKSLQAAALLGITVCIASGDNGAAGIGPKPWDGRAHADFPASSSFALSCGGTRLMAQNGAISDESVWNQKKADLLPEAGQDGSFGSGGGGVSGVFGLPGYQEQARVPGSLNPSGFKGRGVPDVAGDADPATGYNIVVDGQTPQEGGTSAVAPLWAALIARINQKLEGRVGFINPQLYSIQPGTGAFHDITVGDNRVSFKTFKNVGYVAGPGWDATSGLGSPNGTVLSGLLRVGAPATVPKAAKRPARRR